MMVEPFNGVGYKLGRRNRGAAHRFGEGERSRRWAALRSSVQQGTGGRASEAWWWRPVDGGARLQCRGRRKGQVDRLGQMVAWAGRSWAGEGGKMDQASREFGPKSIWAA
jgi:hypothetical protein